MTATPVATFAAPFAMAFMPDGRLLVSERADTGSIRVATTAGAVSAPLAGLPDNNGVLDVALHPQFATNGLIYFSFVEQDINAVRTGRAISDLTLKPAGLAVGLATFTTAADGTPRLDGARVVWRQFPKIVSYPGSGEFGGRLAFSPDGRHFFIAAGDRQEFEPVQSLGNTLGKIVRLLADGAVPGDNPFAGRVDARPEIWTLGHRNPYGLVFAGDGRLWSHEMGPSGGDELNVIVPGSNYGWPNVSYGDHYDGGLITKPAASDGFALSALSWTPVIAPAGLIVYSGTRFAAWRGNAIATGLQSKGLVRVVLNGTTATEVERIPLGARIREVEQGPDGAIWVLEDAPTGRLLRLDPVF